MNVPTMTIGETEQDNELKKLREENEALRFILLHFLPLVKVKRAALSLEITPQAIYNRLRDERFRAEFSVARGVVLEQACYTLQGYIADAVEAMHSIVVDSENSRKSA